MDNSEILVNPASKKNVPGGEKSLDLKNNKLQSISLAEKKPRVNWTIISIFFPGSSYFVS